MCCDPIGQSELNRIVIIQAMRAYRQKANCSHKITVMHNPLSIMGSRYVIINEFDVLGNKIRELTFQGGEARVEKVYEGHMIYGGVKTMFRASVFCHDTSCEPYDTKAYIFDLDLKFLEVIPALNASAPGSVDFSGQTLKEMFGDKFEYVFE